ncbi:MAG: DUF3494 domain-containing protein [Deltaproteobacteria bacterium]|nr:DUF3494 domain-containing protein [Deltaproteobacteria bacterium]
MKRFKTRKIYLVFILLMGGFLITGCGNWDGGGGSSSPGVPGTIIPGAICTIASGPTIPEVDSSNPTSGNLLVTTSTTGVAGGGKLITATFSMPMDPLTINSATAPLTFTLSETATGIPVAGTVTMNATDTIATFTTAAALLPATQYTVNITTDAQSAPPANVAMACSYEWNFTTITPPAAGLAPVDLLSAESYGITATAGVTNTPTVPNTVINGNAVLDPTATCNAVAIDAAGGFGLCGGSPPTINGEVVSPLYPDPGITSGIVMADASAAFLSITPPAGPPAAGSLGGATNIPAGTTLGEPTGSALVVGDNLFYPGVYQSLTSILVTGDLTLDAQGDPDAVFVFQSSTTVGTAAGAIPPGPHTRILLTGGAKASNVWWQAGTDATLGAYSEFQGNILASGNITMITGATSCGRLHAGRFAAGAFVFDSNVVSVPGSPFAPAGCQ